jgi:hypothetical protein
MFVSLPIFSRRHQFEKINPKFVFLFFFWNFAAEDSDTGIGVCGWILTIICWLLVLVTMPFSFFICFKVRGHPRMQISPLIFFFPFESENWEWDIKGRETNANSIIPRGAGNLKC